MQSELAACGDCGAEVSIQVFTGKHIEGEARVLMCSNHRLLGGDCPSDHAALTNEAWNLRAQQPAASGDDPVAVIQEIIDSYSVAGANLLSWLTAEDRKNMPRVKSQTEWQDWANDVACRASFAAWREAKERLATLPTYDQGRKDGIEEADVERVGKAFLAVRYGWSGDPDQWWDRLPDDRKHAACAAAIRALGEPRS